MHFHEHYDAAEARLIYDHVAAFMKQLANIGLKALPE